MKFCAVAIFKDDNCSHFAVTGSCLYPYISTDDNQSAEMSFVLL